MSSNQYRSKLIPGNRAWLLDLSKQYEPNNGKANIDDRLNYIDEDLIELTRRDEFVRGVLILLSGLSLILFIFLFFKLDMDILGGNDVRSLFADSILLLSFIVMGWVSILYARIDLTFSKDTPVRFNRKTGKVLVYQHKINWWNPFAHWPIEIKRFDWADIQAEVCRRTKFDGNVVRTRYTLECAVCRPGTFEVTERFTLVHDSIGEQRLHDIWQWCCYFMDYGRSGLPVPALLNDHQVSLNNSLSRFYPLLCWGEKGRQLRAGFGRFEWIWYSLSLLWLPILLLATLCHYLVMHIAPDPVWPQAGQKQEMFDA